MIQQIYLILKASILFLSKCSEITEDSFAKKSLNMHSRADIKAE